MTNINSVNPKQDEDKINKAYVSVNLLKAKVKEIKPVEAKPSESVAEEDTYVEETTFEVKPSLWQRIKNSKLMRTLAYITKIRIRLDVPALPEGRNQDN